MFQTSLFESSTVAKPQEEKFPLAGGGELIISRSWLNSEQTDRLFETLIETIPWEQPLITVYGKQNVIPRKQAWYGDEGAVMEYSGQRFRPLPWLPALASLRQKLEAELSQSFNSVLANLYRDGNDTVGWHADDEPELGHNPVIASLSLGETRTLCLKPKQRKKRKNGATESSSEKSFQGALQQKRIDLPLHSGDLLIMRGSVQHHWQHSVPREKSVNPRINLTFRKILDKK